MPRRSKGYSKTAYKKKGKWYGRLRLSIGPAGRPKEYMRQARNKTHARQLADELEEKYVAGGTEALDAENMTFADLVARFKEKRLIEPVYIGERKVAGYKHKGKLEGRIDRLAEYFGAQLLSQITLAQIEDYKVHLIKTPTRFEKQRSVYDVNHQLRTLRLLLNFAKKSRWLKENPMDFATEPLINPGDEIPRSRPEKRGEFEKLLRQCVGPRVHLRPWILCAIETSMRPGEITRLTREDILFDEGVIRVTASNSKTNRERYVPLTAPLAAELRGWLNFIAEDPVWSEAVPDEPGARIFGPAASNRKAFSTACRLAGIKDLQRKDLRKWATTRYVAGARRAGIPENQVMTVTGHTKFETFRWYLLTDKETVRSLGDALDAERESKRGAEGGTKQNGHQ